MDPEEGRNLGTVHIIFEHRTGLEYYCSKEEYELHRYKAVNIVIKSPWNIQGFHSAIRHKWKLPGVAQLQATFQLDPEGVTNSIINMITDSMQTKVAGQSWWSAIHFGRLFAFRGNGVRERTRLEIPTGRLVSGSR